MMPVNPAVGTLKSIATVEEAAVTRLRDALPFYLAEVTAQTGLELPPVRGIVTTSEFTHWPEDQLPCVVVVSSGTSGTPVKDAEGFFAAPYSLAVGVVAGARDEAATRALAQWYGAAVRGALLQKRSLSGAVEVTDWEGETLDDLPVEDRRSLLASVNLFSVELRDIASWKSGPADYTVDEDDPPWTVGAGNPTVDLKIGHTAYGSPHILTISSTGTGTVS